MSLDNSDVGWKLFGGYRFNRWLGVEGAIVDLGKFDSRITTTVPNPTQLLSDVAEVHPLSAQGLSVAAVGTLPIGERFTLFGKAGVFVWHGKIESNAGSFGNVNRNKNGADLSIGLGAGLKITNSIHVRAEWERYFIDRNDSDLLSVGLSFIFNLGCELARCALDGSPYALFTDRY